jgi:hypothetical protein
MSLARGLVRRILRLLMRASRCRVVRIYGLLPACEMQKLAQDRPHSGQCFVHTRYTPLCHASLILCACLS